MRVSHLKNKFFFLKFFLSGNWLLHELREKEIISLWDLLFCKFKQSITNQVAEYCNGLYCNTCFLMKKKNKVYHLIINVASFDAVMLKVINLSSADKFSEEFNDMIIASLPNLFSEYD